LTSGASFFGAPCSASLLFGLRLALPHLVRVPAVKSTHGGELSVAGRARHLARRARIAEFYPATGARRPLALPSDRESLAGFTPRKNIGQWAKSTCRRNK
jgi:hypothetical protein